MTRQEPYISEMADLGLVAPKPLIDEKAPVSPALLSFSGRLSTTRFAFWMVLLSCALPSLLLFLNLEVLARFPDLLYGVLGFDLLAFAAIAITWLSLVARRVRDINLSPWFTLLVFFPALGNLFYLALLFLPSSSTADRFGPSNPRATLSFILATWACWIILPLLVTWAFVYYEGLINLVLSQYGLAPELG